MPAPRVTVFSRKGCHLCDKALEVLDSSGVAYSLIDVSSDPGLEAEFGIFVPVVQLDGITVFEAGMDPGDLLKAVAD